ncbi:MAG: 16S rRNA methyltransferase [Chloroflexi bacterium]|nr:MAG: 16S rRNA methyltransferase [Chloroflexota bacterium]
MMMELEKLVSAVSQSAKYRHVSPMLIARIGAQELAKRPNLKAAVKATKNKLHQIGGAYLDAQPDYQVALTELETAVTNETTLRQFCRRWMQQHTSTRERLPILDEFYTTTLADLPDVHRVLDLACGLNPLARPWMPLSPDVTYIASDIYADLVMFVDLFLRRTGGNGRAELRDLIGEPPVETADLILLLKTLPVLEQIEKGAATRLLDALNARYLLITFPARSLGGRNKGMVPHYEAQFQQWIAGRGWQVRRFEFATELAFLVETAVS